MKTRMGKAIIVQCCGDCPLHREIIVGGDMAVESTEWYCGDQMVDAIGTIADEVPEDELRKRGMTYPIEELHAIKEFCPIPFAVMIETE